MTRVFEPIAIVGQGCVLPGCLQPADLWSATKKGQSLLTRAATDAWRLNLEKYLRAAPGEHSKVPVRSDIGGYVTATLGELALDDLAVPRAELEELDPVVQWSVHAAVTALADAKVARTSSANRRAGVILGNLSYPTRSYTRYFEHAILGDRLALPKAPKAINRFMSGYPAMATAQAVGFAGPAFCLDAACASGLYAIKLACDKLQRNECDLMLAGGVNAADPLFIFSGFATLQALSQSGRSRPFHQEADGLVPSEGAAIVALKRLVDAERDGDKIAGVIRGIGLSNDGRSSSFLSPSMTGQVRAMQSAFAQSGGLRPNDVSLVECHATGTAAGDGVEVRSLEAVYGRRDDLSLSALKANLGHSITASAAAGLIRTLAAIDHGMIAPTPHAFPLLPSISECGYRVSDKSISWPYYSEDVVAAVSAFGMGGNNAHLLVQKWQPHRVTVAPSFSTEGDRPIAVVAVGVRTNDCADTLAFLRALLSGSAPRSVEAPHEMTVSFDPRTLASPPNDLRHALGQQLLFLETTLAAVAEIKSFDPSATGVFVGMAADPQVNRFLLRVRLEDLLRAANQPIDADWCEKARRAIEDTLQPPDVVGTMPNIPANRINFQFDLGGPGFTVSAEENSGVEALRIALDALKAGEISSAIVGGVDLCREPSHERAIAETLRDIKTSADVAVVLVLKPLALAEAQGDRVLATIDCGGEIEQKNGLPLISAKIAGHSHAAAGLLEIAAGILALQAGARLETVSGKLVPILSERTNAIETVVTKPAHAPIFSLASRLKRRASSGARSELRPKMYCFAGDNLADLRVRLKSNARGGDGPCRLAFAASSAIEAKEKLGRVRGWATSTSNADQATPDGIFFHKAPVGGDLAFAFTGAAAAYAGMGRELLVGLPELLDDAGMRFARAKEYASWIYEPHSMEGSDPFYQLAGSSFLCQVHARLTREVLGLKPHAALGLSSGETNALYALGVWSDFEALFDDLRTSNLYTRELAADFSSVRRYWKKPDDFRVQWENWLVRARISEVRAALRGEEQVYLTIITTQQESVIAGDADGCRRVLARLRNPRAVPLGHDLAVHCPVVTPFEATWRKLHTRPTAPSEGVRWYSNYFGGEYRPTQQSVADALTGQALQTIDFPRIIEQAYQDGVRVFVEHGPRNSLSAAIGTILGDRPHLAVALDVPGKSSLMQAGEAAAVLWSAGVDLRTDAFDPDGGVDEASKPKLAFALRKPPIELPSWPEDVNPKGSIVAKSVTPRTLPKAPDLLPFSRTGDLVVPDTSNLAADSPLVRIHVGLMSAHREFLDRQSVAWRLFLDQQQQLQALMLAMPCDVESTKTEEIVSAPAQVRERVAPMRDIWAPSPRQLPHGPRFDRAQLEVLASGKISSIFGPRFSAQDGYAIQVRMPEPPLLLCDRVVGIEGEPGSMGKGIVWTETDVREDSWYLHCGHMPGGIFIEAGQADLLLVSWLGVDQLNRGERAYRLLGCELMFHDELPKVGETLHYQIHVDGHANQGDVRLFFFHYDCWIGKRARISVRHGQAGFFTKAELASSGGVLWSPEEAEYSLPKRIEILDHATKKTAFTAEDVEAFAQGKLETCFGATFDWGSIHSRTPTIRSGRYNLLGEVVRLDFQGGPAQRGYLRARRRLKPDDWFYEGHFKNDPCMPGTLMAEGCLQALSFYLIALGYSHDRDGWRCEPVTETKYTFVCRGQATPESRELIYELFVDQIGYIDGRPTVFAHVLCTVDGLKAFKCERLGLRLVNDFPMNSVPRSEWERPERLPVAQLDGLTLDYKSVLACAIGDPTQAFGPTFHPFKRVKQSPRLPNPPFLFCTHVAHAERTPMKSDSKASVEMLFDLDDRAWYFTETAERTLPLCAVMEIALQACGWLSSYVLEPETANWEPLFRNLDGVGTQYCEVRPGDKTIATKVQLVSRMVLGEQIIIRFLISSTVDGKRLFESKSTFGLFAPSALAETKGMTPSAAEQVAIGLQGSFCIELAANRERYRREKNYEIPGPKLLRLDRLTTLLPHGGAHGLGYIRGEKDVRKDDWVFKAHFYQDPVQPGSIGAESILQAVKCFLLETETIPEGCRPEFESILIGHEFQWTYRGQVLPKHRLVTVDFDVKERTVQTDGVMITGDGRLWVDGKKIYHLERFGTRLRFVREPEARGKVDTLTDLSRIERPVLRKLFTERHETQAPILQDLFVGMIEQFVAGVDVVDPRQFAELLERPVLYVANHQVGIESMLFVGLMDLLSDVSCRAIAKSEHRESWLGRVMELVQTETGRESIMLFDRTDPAALLKVLGKTADEKGAWRHSLLAHVQGTRSLKAGEATTQVSSALIDFAVRCGIPLVPVRFGGGLPREALKDRIDFPHGFGKQRYTIGRAILPSELRDRPSLDRKNRVLEAINETGPRLADEKTAPANPPFGQQVELRRTKENLSLATAVMATCLENAPDNGEATRTLLAQVHAQLPSQFDPYVQGLGFNRAR